jgi:hypothetical protein
VRVAAQPDPRRTIAMVPMALKMMTPNAPNATSEVVAATTKQATPASKLPCATNSILLRSRLLASRCCTRGVYPVRVGVTRSPARGETPAARLRRSGSGTYSLSVLRADPQTGTRLKSLR